MIEGCHRFLARLWRLATGERSAAVVDREPADADVEIERATHRLIDRVTDDFDRWSYNTAVAGLMEFVNAAATYSPTSAGAARQTLDAVDTCSCCWRRCAPTSPPSCGSGATARQRTVHAQPWPVADPALAAVDHGDHGRAGQRQGPRRLEVDPGISEADAERAGPRPPRWSGPLGGAEPRRSSPGPRSWSTSSSELRVPRASVTGPAPRPVDEPRC